MSVRMRAAVAGAVLALCVAPAAQASHKHHHGKNEGEKVPGEHRHWPFRTRRDGIGATPDPEHAS